MLPLHHLPLLGLPTWPTFGLGTLLVVEAAVMLYVWLRGKDLASTVVVFAAMILGAAVGSQALYSVMGGAAGAIVGVVCIRRMLPGRFPAVTLAIVSLFGMIAIGRIGCFLSGCCFGAETTVPWGVTYGPGSAAFFLHRALGQMGEHALHSRPVHPVQLYESAFLSTLVILIALLRRRMRDQNALVWYAAGAYFFFRAAIECIRDYSNVAWGVAPWGPLSRFQWLMLGIGLVLSAVPLVRGFAALVVRAPAQVERPLSLRGLGAFAVILMVTSPVLYWRVPFGLGVALLVSTIAVVTALAASGGYVPARRGLLRPALLGVAICLCVAPFAWRTVAGDSESAADTTRPAGVYGVDTLDGKLVRVGTVADPQDSLDARLARVNAGGGAAPTDTSRPHWNMAMVAGGSYGRAVWDRTESGCSGPSYMYRYRESHFRGMVGAEEVFSASPAFTLAMGQRLHLGIARGILDSEVVTDGRIHSAGTDYLYSRYSIMGSYYFIGQWPLVAVGAGLALGVDSTYTPWTIWRLTEPQLMVKVGDPANVAVTLDWNMPRTPVPYQKAMSLRLGWPMGPVGFSTGATYNPYRDVYGFTAALTHVVSRGISYSLTGGYWAQGQWYLSAGVRIESPKGKGPSSTPRSLHTLW